MKPILKQVLIPVVSAIAGGLVVVGAQNLSPDLQPKNDVSHPTIQSRESISDNIFAQGDPFDSWFSNQYGGGTVNDISKREDDNSVYYDIKLNGVNSTSINTIVENGYVTVTGTTERKSGSDDMEYNGFSAQSVYRSTFNRTFPLPEHVDESKMQMTSEKDKIVLIFPKIKT